MGDTPSARRDDSDPDSVLHEWSLSAADLREIDRTRGPEGRLWTALHLCSLRQSGRFVEDAQRVSHEAVIHVAQQIGLEPPAQLLSLHRQATDSAVRARVRDHLGFAAFSPDAAARLTDRLADFATDGLGTVELIERAQALLLADRIILPSPGALERLVLSVNRQALERLFARIATRLPPPCVAPSTAWLATLVKTPMGRRARRASADIEHRSPARWDALRVPPANGSKKSTRCSPNGPT